MQDGRSTAPTTQLVVMSRDAVAAVQGGVVVVLGTTILAVLVRLNSPSFGLLTYINRVN